jgi:NitT/TauT family transport system substrate-binding protein
MHRVLLALLVAASLGTTGCATSSDVARSTAAAWEGPTSAAAELRLGYFPNITHATAVFGVDQGVFAESLGDTALRTQAFNAGPAAVEALFAGAIDAAYIGPNPTVNAFLKSSGQALRIVAGATSGGAALIVRPGIDDVAQLRGRTLATPQTGNTQDIALRNFLAHKGFAVDRRGAGDVMILAQENSQTLPLFQSGQIDGAWVPEPWASRLVLEGGGQVLVNERDLWPQGRFVTTHLVVRTEFLRSHPETVRRLIEGSVESNRRIAADEPGAKLVVNAALSRLTGKPLAADTIDRAWSELELTDDPVATSLKASAEHAFDTGLVKRAGLEGIYDLSLLQDVLRRGIDDAGLGGTDS